MISNSGFEDILYQADICTSGAIKGVISGKHYNRSWAVHECFSEALERLFFESEYESLKFDQGLLDLVTSVKNKDSSFDLMNNPIFTSYFEKYNSIKEQYLLGKKGEASKFWVMYLELINLLHLFHCSGNLNNF